MIDQGLRAVASSAAMLRSTLQPSGQAVNAELASSAVCAALIDSVAQGLEGYRQWPQPVEDMLRQWAPPSTSDLVLQLRLNQLLLALVETLPDRLLQSGLPGRFAEEYRHCALRITQRIAQARRWNDGVEDDIFRKDLALLCLRMVPCVSHVVCRNSGIPRSTLLLPRNLASGASLRVLLALRGRLRPLIANHVHPEMTDRFDPAGREACYRLVCALLEHWPDSEGLVGASWYYDRAVGDISPKLAYLRDVPARHGALFLDAGATDEATANAVSRSERRRARVEDGTYRPRTVMMVWPRRALLEHLPHLAATRAVV
jgi:hypothetical protein